ncbi:putative DNA-binding domain-containing protein [Novosphingobium sp. FKTRR1]|uniref:HvfC/BufC family peptide modification chaperone n=1 Tax=Novosphingobium sp. FKTRR1 TaxID=2879118 RepID=UPI001CF028B0|nr:putative DNA-binding domain-containing protein [Novosphingobium sp. FKTRR1]
MSLSALQQDFRDWLVTGSDEAQSRFSPDAAPGLLVYQNNYRCALMACLEESFAKTLAWIGPELFHAIAAAHIDARPPESWSLDHYAAYFPQALAQALPDDTEVGELAMLEQALTDAFVGPDGAALALGDVPQVDWDRAVLRWVPTARLLSLASNAPAIWSALAANREPPPRALLAEPVRVLVWRQEDIACFRALDPQEAEVAPTLLGGATFTAICARLVDAHGEAQGVQLAGAWLGRWVADGALAAL